VFSFSEMTVNRLMTARPDIIAFPLSVPYPRLVEELRRDPLSRVPIYQGRLDEVVGILLTKDLLRFRGKPPPGPRELKGLLQEPWFVPTTKLADELLQEFQQRQVHMVIVVDEHGSIAGLVTLDDLLSELVGELMEDDDDLSLIAEDLWRVSGAMGLDYFNEATGLGLPEGEYTTVGGFLLSRLGHVPERDEQVEHEGTLFTVAGMEGRRITEITLKVLPDHVMPTEEIG